MLANILGWMAIIGLGGFALWLFIGRLFCDNETINLIICTVTLVIGGIGVVGCGIYREVNTTTTSKVIIYTVVGKEEERHTHRRPKGVPTYTYSYYLKIDSGKKVEVSETTYNNFESGDIVKVKITTEWLDGEKVGTKYKVILNNPLDN